MNLPFSLNAPEYLKGTAGTYQLYAQGNGNKLYINTEVVQGLGRHNGTTYNAYSLVLRMLFSGDDPKTIEGLELRDKKAYKNSKGEDAYAQQLNKMLFPISTPNCGTAGLVEALGFHFEALSDLLEPLLEANQLTCTTDLPMIFEAQNPQFYIPVVNFPPPSSLLSWEESIKGIKDAAQAKYEPKNPGYQNEDPTQD